VQYYINDSGDATAAGWRAGAMVRRRIQGRPSPSAPGSNFPFFLPPLSLRPRCRSPPLPCLPIPSFLPFIALEVGPLKSGYGSEERCKLPRRGSGAEAQLQSNLAHFSFKIWHLVATILMIFSRINLPKFCNSLPEKILPHNSFQEASCFHLSMEWTPLPVC